jgi:hypothetical protein
MMKRTRRKRRITRALAPLVVPGERKKRVVKPLTLIVVLAAMGSILQRTRWPASVNVGCCIL